MLGRGGVTVIRGDQEQRFGTRQKVPLTALGTFHPPADSLILPPEIPAPPEASAQNTVAPPSQEVRTLMVQREKAREMHDWAEADRLREKILELGWSVQDSADGPLPLPV